MNYAYNGPLLTFTTPHLELAVRPNKLYRSADRNSRFRKRQNGGQPSIGARIDEHEWFAHLKALADFLDARESDGKIDRVSGFLPPASKQDRRATN